MQVEVTYCLLCGWLNSFQSSYLLTAKIVKSPLHSSSSTLIICRQRWEENLLGQYLLNELKFLVLYFDMCGCSALKTCFRWTGAQIISFLQVYSRRRREEIEKQRERREKKIFLRQQMTVSQTQVFNCHSGGGEHIIICSVLLFLLLLRQTCLTIPFNSKWRGNQLMWSI